MIGNVFSRLSCNITSNETLEESCTVEVVSGAAPSELCVLFDHLFTQLLCYTLRLWGTGPRPRTHSAIQTGTFTAQLSKRTEDSQRSCSCGCARSPAAWPPSSWCRRGPAPPWARWWSTRSCFLSETPGTCCSPPGTGRRKDSEYGWRLCDTSQIIKSLQHEAELKMHKT